MTIIFRGKITQSRTCQLVSSLFQRSDCSHLQHCIIQFSEKCNIQSNLKWREHQGCSSWDDFKEPQFLCFNRHWGWPKSYYRQGWTFPEYENFGARWSHSIWLWFPFGFPISHLALNCWGKFFTSLRSKIIKLIKGMERKISSLARSKHSW